jgi:plastocyanin
MQASDHRLLLALGAGLVALGALASLGSADSFGLFLAVPSLVAAGFAWRFGGFVALPSLVVTLLLFGPFILFERSDLGIHLGAFDIYPEFVPALAQPAGAAFLVAGSAWSIAGRASRRPPGSPRSRIRLAAYVLAGAVIAACVASIVVSSVSPSTISARAKAGAVHIVMPDASYSVREMDASAGATVRVFLDNKDRTTHTFTIDELALDTILGGRRQRLVVFRAPRRGQFTYYCRVSGHDDQSGTLFVR